LRTGDANINKSAFFVHIAFGDVFSFAGSAREVLCSPPMTSRTVSGTKLLEGL
jgi:hypothetical protein